MILIEFQKLSVNSVIQMRWLKEKIKFKKNIRKNLKKNKKKPLKNKWRIIENIGLKKLKFYQKKHLEYGMFQTKLFMIITSYYKKDKKLLMKQVDYMMKMKSIRIYLISIYRLIMN